MNALEIYAAFLNMLEILDRYTLSKNPDGIHSIDVELRDYKQNFKSDDIYNLMELLGKWLCKLPKSTWV